ncbi:MAG: betaine/proline/choline family ABC transporter ATP-binding protein [Streptosporangiales bacterium]|nr:betaine/proline/choline family ABC transporter ATP-binding protein [Streptosporangiales bacterium]
MPETTAPEASTASSGNGHLTGGASIELRDVTKRYPGQAKAAVDSFNVDIPAGEIVMFVGPSGCGKTTTLKMINRLIEPTSGHIVIGGEDVTGINADQLRRRIGYVIQAGGLFPHMTVGANIGLVPGMLKWDKKRISERIDELLELVSLDPGQYRNRYPRELSGGQQQRVGVARALAADPPVLLMDEPFGAVDPITRQRLQDELLRIHEEVPKTICFVTHDFDEAVKLGDRIAILTEGAKIAQFDTPDAILGNPANEFVEDFVGHGSSLKQLTLTRVDQIELERATTATVGEDSRQVAAKARGEGNLEVLILDDRGRPARWEEVKDLERDGGSIERGTEQVETIGTKATLNDALDTMLISSHGAAVVTGRGDVYQGLVSVETVMNAIQTARTNARADTERINAPAEPAAADAATSAAEQDRA